ncbi:molybdate transport system ATP-binding protein [Pedobacter sp. CG_S7]|uniref:ATP-binding cassette domain-containing protein n=1 Tax=Pedobacter sp. CG_S7 TaxID=3143930 RepID=UPI003390B2B2
MTEPFVHIENLSINFRKNVVWAELFWTINKGENWLLTGASGSGKTVLAKVIAGLIHTSGSLEINYRGNLTPKTLFVAQWFPFKDKQGTANFYYQQRYNSTEAEDCNTVWEEISAYCKTLGKMEQNGMAILQSFDLLHRKDAPLIQLSSGEHKKLQLSKALLLQPQLLILDNPYTGLDAQTRQNLNTLINQACAGGMQLILISNDGNEPSCIRHFAKLANGKFSTSLTRDVEIPNAVKANITLPAFLNTPLFENQELVKLTNVNIQYGEKIVLNHINWTVKKGEKWLLQGPNGYGKSTLLSLLTGDNPQAYANEIYLFGKRRGSGESIWDIKKNIGFISPELQWFFEPASTVFQTIASGFFDTAGLFRKVSAEQNQKVIQLMELLDLAAEEHSLLTQLPLGKQRLAFLARAIIKNPPLLILDEPCQGLDQQQTNLFNNLVDVLCTTNRSLIYVGHFENRLPGCIEHRLSLNNGVATNIGQLLEQEITT